MVINVYLKFKHSFEMSWILTYQIHFVFGHLLYIQTSSSSCRWHVIIFLCCC